MRPAAAAVMRIVTIGGTPVRKINVLRFLELGCSSQKGGEDNARR